VPQQHDLRCSSGANCFEGIVLQVALLQNTSSLDVALARNASTYNTGELDISQLWNVRPPRVLQMCKHQPSSGNCCDA
jgi:hypothetical protein